MKIFAFLNRKKDALPLKTISFKGEIAFRIPASWCEDEEGEQGCYYADQPNSGTLRCQLLRAVRTDQAAETPFELLLHSKNAAVGKVRRLPDGNAILEYQLRAEENGVPLTLYYWQIANMPTVRTLRMAIFSFTVKALSATDTTTKQALHILQQEIPPTVFQPY